MKKLAAKTSKIKLIRARRSSTGEKDDRLTTEENTAVETKKRGKVPSDNPDKKKKKVKRPSPEQEKAMVEFANTVLTLEHTGIINEFNEKVSKIVPEKEKCSVFYANMELNRNQKTPILNETRVELEGAPPTYVNASRVKMKHTTKAFIAAQLPVTDHVEEFWRMIFQENCTYLLVLCNQFDSSENYTQMMPVDVGDYRHFGTMFVNIRKVEKHSRDKVTEVRKDEKPKQEPSDDKNSKNRASDAPPEASWLTYTVEVLPDGCSNSLITKVVLYQNWEKGAAPPHLRHISAFAVRLLDTKEIGTSCVISVDGVGRAGVQLATTAATVIIENGLTPNVRKELNNVLETTQIFEIVTDLRSQRACSVENSLQYATIYQCIMAYIGAKLKDISTHNQLREKMEAFNKKWSPELFLKS